MTSTPSSSRVFVTGVDIDHDALSPLSVDGIALEFEPEALPVDALAGRLVGFRYYLYGGIEAADKLDAKQFRDLRDAGLELIAFAGKGVRDFLDVPSAHAAGIAVTNTPGAVEPSVAEFTVYLLVAALRHAPQRALAWLGSVGLIATAHALPSSSVLGVDLSDTTVGILGLGDIGQRVARILTSGYQTRVLYYSRTRRPNLESELGLAYVSPEELVMQSDAITIHLETNPDTIRLVKDVPFERSTGPLVLVNTASQRLMDPSRLARLLSTDRIATAAFDKIYSQSELSATGLAGFLPDRLIVTDHAANTTRSAWRRMTSLAVANIVAHAEGTQPPNLLS